MNALALRAPLPAGLVHGLCSPCSGRTDGSRTDGGRTSGWRALLAARAVALGVSWLMGLLAASGAGAGELVQVPSRPGVQTSVFWAPQPQTEQLPSSPAPLQASPSARARATVLLFPGGAGSLGSVRGGQAQGRNFLVRSAPYFLAQGFHVAIVGRPSDVADLGYGDRLSDWHLQDVRAVLDFVQRQVEGPVWLIGTSRGTLSAAAAAAALGDRIAGLVLSSSVVSNRKSGPRLLQQLARIRVPVLVLHHRLDACAFCRPQQVPTLLAALTQAPVKQLIWAEGGANPSGDPCGALHWHGYIGMEREAVALIANWIRAPSDGG